MTTPRASGRGNNTPHYPHGNDDFLIQIVFSQGERGRAGSSVHEDLKQCL